MPSTSDDIKREIIDFVRKNEGCSEGMLIRHLIKEGVCSKETTRNYVRLLKSEKGGTRIIIEPDKRPNNKTHHLRLNEKSHFNIMEERLSEFEGIISRMPDYVKAKGKGKSNSYEKWYISSDHMMTTLHFYLLSISRIPHEQDTQILYQKLIKLIIRLHLKQTKARDKEYIIRESLENEDMIVSRRRI